MTFVNLCALVHRGRCIRDRPKKTKQQKIRRGFHWGKQNETKQKTLKKKRAKKAKQIDMFAAHSYVSGKINYISVKRSERE